MTFSSASFKARLSAVFIPIWPSVRALRNMFPRSRYMPGVSATRFFRRPSWVPSVDWRSHRTFSVESEQPYAERRSWNALDLEGTFLFRWVELERECIRFLRNGRGYGVPFSRIHPHVLPHFASRLVYFFISAPGARVPTKCLL